LHGLDELFDDVLRRRRSGIAMQVDDIVAAQAPRLELVDYQT
jgi:hypothetical protein